MRTLKLFTIFDNKAQVYAPPFTARSTGEAERMLSDTAADPNSNIGRHPNDFELHLIGTFEIDTGVVAGGPHLNLGPASSFVQDVQLQLPDGLFNRKEGGE